MRIATERLKINKSDTQKDGIEYPNRVESVMMTSVGRPRLHPEIRPRMIPSHIVAAVAPPTRISVGQRGGGGIVVTRAPVWEGVGGPGFPVYKLRREVTKATVKGRAK